MIIIVWMLFEYRSERKNMKSDDKNLFCNELLKNASDSSSTTAFSGEISRKMINNKFRELWKVFCS